MIFQLEGSVDEESTKTDEEYDDLAMQDTPEGGISCDDEELGHKSEVEGVLSSWSGKRLDKLDEEKYQLPTPQPQSLPLNKNKSIVRVAEMFSTISSRN